jgi:hypothetical protein
MITSTSIKEISSALAKAQGQIKPAIFDSVNPHFKSKYASLSAIMDAAKKPLSDNGLAVVQSIEKGTDGLLVVTTIMHQSGEFISDSGLPLMLDKNNMQGLGSAITYAKRYSISSMLGIVADQDDDANAASKPVNKTTVNTVNTASIETKKPSSFMASTEQINTIKDLLAVKLGYTKDECILFIARVAGKSSTADLTDKDAIKVIDAANDVLKNNPQVK